VMAEYMQIPVETVKSCPHKTTVVVLYTDINYCGLKMAKTK
jgi:hypothetical protein